VAGNCRMCLVEIEKSPKPVPSCTLQVMEGMKVFTKTPLVQKAQESVLEFLLINHPLDCPICDQGGECDLQDQSINFGSDSSRFYIKKRGVEDKNIGPIVKTVMTRCIHCTRCVRFATEVAGLKDLGTTGRGKKTEIGTYISKVLKTELSGNVVDLCPVGALTSKPYAFKARPWELKSTNSIDILDSLGSNIVVNSKGNDIVRILPRLNESLNEEWLTDKARFSFDGIKCQRLDSPLLKDKFGQFVKVSWELAFDTLSCFFGDLIKKKGVNNIQADFILGDLSDLNTVVEVQSICDSLKFKSNVFFNYEGLKKNINKDLSTNLYSSDFNYNLKKSDLILMVNTDIKCDLSLLNVKMRNHILKTGSNVGLIGPKINPGYDYNHLGLDLTSLVSLVEGNSLFLKQIISSKKPLILLNNSLLSLDTSKLINIFKDINPNASFSLINSQTGFIGCLDLGLDSSSSNDYFNSRDVTFNFGNKSSCQSKSSFNVYIGHTGHKSLSNMDLILPSLTYLEKSSFYMNFNGLIQKTNKASTSIVNARSDDLILKMLLVFLQKKGLDVLLSTKSNAFNCFVQSYLKTGEKFLLKGLDVSGLLNSTFHLSGVKPINDSFYITNIISASSKVMQECELLNVKKLNF